VLILCAVFAGITPATARALDKHIPPPTPGIGSPASRAPQLVRPLGPEDKAFLKELSRRSFRYFWEQADPHTGLVLDRARPDGAPGVSQRPPDRASRYADLRARRLHVDA